MFQEERKKNLVLAMKGVGWCGRERRKERDSGCLNVCS